MKTWVYRVQDHEGRGPYRPGLSVRWLDPTREGKGGETPDVFSEFGIVWMGKILSGQAAGCAFRSLDQLTSWFSKSELRRLYRLGFSVVTFEADAILAESKHQMVIARNCPLRADVREIKMEAVAP
jgi:hypothetical protein